MKSRVSISALAGSATAQQERYRGEIKQTVLGELWEGNRPNSLKQRQCNTF